MNRNEYKAFFDAITEFCKTNDIRNHPTKYYTYRRRLIEIANDESLDPSIRRDASSIQQNLKWTFYSVVGRGDSNRNKLSGLYAGHHTLTTACMNKVTKLAERFAFKPHPLVQGIKHYYARA